MVFVPAATRSHYPHGPVVGVVLQGFALVYCGEERSTKVSKLLPGLRYSFKLQVRRSSLDQGQGQHMT